MTTLPLDFPGLEAEARRMVGDILDTGLDGSDTMRLANTAQPLIRAHARLLTDLTRPESQCFWLRALGARYGLLPLPVGSLRWLRPQHQPGYALSGSWKVILFVPVGFALTGDRYIQIPGVEAVPSTPEGDIEGLRLALCAAFGVTP